MDPSTLSSRIKGTANLFWTPKALGMMKADTDDKLLDASEQANEYTSSIFGKFLLWKMLIDVFFLAITMDIFLIPHMGGKVPFERG